MSYCVNCGVELEPREKRCPLCSTPVINPNTVDKEIETPPVYPIQSELLVERKIKRTTAILITMILVVPLLVCPLCDVLITGALSWSKYAVLGILLGWVLIVPPLLMSHSVVLKSAWLDFFAILAFLYLLYHLNSIKYNWFEQLSLPILCLLMMLFIITYTVIVHIKPRPMTIAALLSSLSGLFCVGVDLLTSMFLGRGIVIYWSLPVVIACIAISVIFLVISRLAKLKQSIKKRMHI